MNLVVTLTVFAIIFPAELPDKTALASLVLAGHYRPSFVFAGVALAFAVHSALAVAAGSVLGLLPHLPLQIVVTLLFVLGAVLLLRGRHEDEQIDEHSSRRHGFWRSSGAGFVVIMVAEFGDLTQIVTANLAAKYHDPIAVGVGATLALWAVAGLAIVGGRGLLKLIPLQRLTQVAAAIMLIMAAVTLVTAVT